MYTGQKAGDLRFLYDWDGKALSAEPSSLPQIKKHISRLSTVVNKHSDCVYILQGTFTGNNGEMNNSNYGDLNQIRQIIEELDNDISREIYLAVPYSGAVKRYSPYQYATFKFRSLQRHTRIQIKSV